MNNGTYTDEFIYRPADNAIPAYNLKLLKMMPVSGIAQYLSARNDCKVIGVKAVRQPLNAESPAINLEGI